MYLYQLTLQTASGICQAVYGSFSAVRAPLPPFRSLAPSAPSGGAAAPDAEHLRAAQAKRQEIVVAKGAVLELLRPDDNGKVQVIHSTQVFGVVRALANFRLTGARKSRPPRGLCCSGAVRHKPAP